VERSGLYLIGNTKITRNLSAGKHDKNVGNPSLVSRGYQIAF